MLIDTHAHLDMKEFKYEVASVIGRARQRGVERIINVGVDPASSKASIDMARRYPEIYAAVGIHPDVSDQLDVETRQQLLEYATFPKVVAIGEIGLDYYYLKRSSKYAHYPRREVQIFCFEQMLDLAAETGLPVIVHSREAESDTLGVLKGYGGTLRGVVHCFQGDLDFANKILDLGMAISFTGSITFKKNAEYASEVVKKIPIGSIMVETDSPLLTPEPYRGQRNEPANVIEVARKIAQVKGISLVEVETETTKKAKKLFNIA